MSATLPAAARRLRSIQGLRAVAVLLVVLYHADFPIGAGYIGVDVFFVISGFVIMRLLVSRSAATTRISLRNFWAARVRRLAPALGVAIVLTLLLSIPFASPVGAQHDIGITAIASVGWVANLALTVLTFGYFADVAEQNPLLHMWSLAVEEQFYVAFPLLVVAVLWWTRRHAGKKARLLALAIAALTALSFAASVYLTYAKLPVAIGPTLAFFAPFTRAWEFGAGALIALLPVVLQLKHARWVAAAGGGLLVAGLVVIKDPTSFPGYIAILPVVGSALICWASSSVDGGILSSEPMVWIGNRSYGWYLFHWPLIVLLTGYVAGPIAAVLGLVLADLSLRYVENPIRERRRLPRLSAPRLWLVTSLPVVGLSVFLMVASSQHWWNPSVEAFAARVSRGVHPVQSECQSVTPVSQRDLTPCIFGPADDDSPIILIGDSNAGMYADTAVRAAQEAGRRITVATIPSCQVADVTTARPGQRQSGLIDCLDRYADTIAWLETQPASTVLVVSGSSVADLDQFNLVDAHGTEYKGARAKQREFEASLQRAYSTIEAQGHRVVAVELIPQWAESDGSAWNPRDCRLLEFLRDAATCDRQERLSEMDRKQRRTLKAERDAAEATGVEIVEVRDNLCPDGVCGTNRNGDGLYSDGAHLTPDAADLVRPQLVDVMKDPASTPDVPSAPPLP